MLDCVQCPRDQELHTVQCTGFVVQIKQRLDLINHLSLYNDIVLCV